MTFRAQLKRFKAKPATRSPHSAVPNSSAGNLLWQTEHSLMSLCNTKILKCTDKGDPLSVGNELRASGVVLCFGGVFY